MLANEFGIIELLEEFSKKNSVYDDYIKEHIQRLKTYKVNLEVIERRFIQIAAGHYNL